MNQLSNRRKVYRFFQHNSKGFTLIEVVMALGLLGIIAAAFLMALSTGSAALFMADERTTAESLARTQMEHVKRQPYEYGASPSYGQVDVESITHPGFFISVDAAPLRDPDDGIQKITVTIRRHGEIVLTLEGFKAHR